MDLLLEGGDSHGHPRMTDNTHGGLNARQTWMRKVRNRMPDRKLKRTPNSMRVPVPTRDSRRLDLN
eukprot:1014525-Pyramimonas_sp.AAC.1